MNSKSLLLPIALSGGCVAHVDGEVPLTDAHAIEMAEYMRQESLATPMAVELARHVTVGAVDATGESSTGERLAVDIGATASWLQTEYANGRIMEADQSLFETSDALAQYDPGETKSKKDDHIVVTSNSKWWSLALFVHEAAHKLFYHDIMVTQEIRESGGEFNAGFADAVIMYKDFAYMLSALYFIPGDLVSENQKVINDALEKARVTADSGDWVTAMQELKGDLEMRTPEEAEIYIREAYGNQSEMFEQFGVSMDEVSSAYFDSGLYESLIKERDESRREFHEEYKAEVRSERKLL